MGKRRASAYTPEERKLGQLNWAARQGRCDLTFASSLVQQPAGQGKAQAPCWINSAVRRAREGCDRAIRRFDCSLEDLSVDCVGE